MKIIKNIHALLLITAFTACESFVKEDNSSLFKSKTDLVTIKIADLDDDPLLNMSTLIKKINFVPLEFTKKSILGNIKKVLISTSSIYILDAQNREGIIKFDLTGKFISVLGHQGKGPGEHVEITDFSINEHSKSIYLYDNSQRKPNIAWVLRELLLITH